MRKLIVVAGPTASGKTELALDFARKFGGEIVSADSMQIYRYMDIGTAKPTDEHRAAAPHHMIDILQPGELYSVAKYASDASRCVDDILARGKLPIICGGTGLYIDALIKGRVFSQSGQDTACRSELEEKWENGGAADILQKLQEVDPQSAQRLHPNDKKRILRAMEVFLQTGENISAHNERTKALPPKYDAGFVGLRWSREVLYSRINQRVLKMLEQGLIEETKSLMERGFLKGTAAQAIAYKEMLEYLSAEKTLEQSTALLQQKSRNYAKRQITWFGRDARVNWVECGENCDFAQICANATKIVTACGVE